MAEGIALEAFRVLTQRAGLALSDDELVSLKPMFDFYAEQIHILHSIDLGSEDLAVAFVPTWNPQG